MNLTVFQCYFSHTLHSVGICIFKDCAREHVMRLQSLYTRGRTTKMYPELCLQRLSPVHVSKDRPLCMSSKIVPYTCLQRFAPTHVPSKIVPDATVLKECPLMHASSKIVPYACICKNCPLCFFKIVPCTCVFEDCPSTRVLKDCPHACVFKDCPLRMCLQRLSPMQLS